MRVIVAGRLSRKAADRDQTGFDSQERDSVRWAQSQGHEVVAVVADYKSGRSGLESRPSLRPWVTEPDKLAQYDAIVALKVDRLTRGDRQETTKLEQWARDHGKQLVIVGADVHFPSEGNEGIQWDLMLRMAHQEWLNTSERYRRSQKYLTEKGSLVGRAPFGYQIVKSGDIKTLEPHPVHAEYVRQAVDRYLSGDSLRLVGAWLDSEGIRPSQAKSWNAKSLADLFRNTCLIGRRKNAQGRTVLKFQGILDFETWTKLQAALDSRTRHRGALKGAALLTGIAKCGKCSRPMYAIDAGNTRKDGTRVPIFYFRCYGPVGNGVSPCRNMVRMDALEEAVDAWITQVMGKLRVVAVLTELAQGHEDDIAEIEQDIRDLDLDDPEYDQKLAALRLERRRLQSLPAESPRTTEVDMGMNVAEWWTTKTESEKRAFLLSGEVSLKVTKDDLELTARGDEGAWRI